MTIQWVGGDSQGIAALAAIVAACCSVLRCWLAYRSRAHHDVHLTRRLEMLVTLRRTGPEDPPSDATDRPEAAPVRKRS